MWKTFMFALYIERTTKKKQKKPEKNGYVCMWIEVCGKWGHGLFKKYVENRNVKNVYNVKYIIHMSENPEK